MKRIERYYLGSNMLDALAGSSAGLITQLIVVNQLGFTGTNLGILSSLSIILYLVSAIPIGKMVDALQPATVLISALVVKALLLVTLTFLYISGGLSFWTVLILQVLQSLTGIFIDNSQVINAVSIQSLTGESKLVPRLESADIAVGIIAPGVVALFAAGEFYKEGYIGSAVLVLIALLMIAFPVKKMLNRAVADVEATNDSSRCEKGVAEEYDDSILAGFRLVARSRESLVPVLLIAAGNFGLAYIDSPKTLFLLREIEMSPSGFSSLKIVSAIAGLIASLLSVWLIERLNFAQLVTIATLGQVFSTLAFLIVIILNIPAFTFTAISNAIWSASVVLINISAMNFFVSKLPEGRVGIGLSSMRTLVMLVVPVGSLLGGYCADHVGYAFSAATWSTMSFATFIIAASLFLKRR